MKRNLLFLPIPLVLILLIISTVSFSYFIGITVISKQGNSLYLYKDYHALVIGISNYEHWPKLPYAVEDAKQIAERKKGHLHNILMIPYYPDYRNSIPFSDIRKEIFQEGMQKKIFRTLA